MRAERGWTSVVLTFAGFTLGAAAWAGGFAGGVREALGPRFDHERQTLKAPRRHSQPPGMAPVARLRFWNEIALDASALDHTPVAPGEIRTYGEQLGPGRTGRAFAIVHIAIFDAVNAIARRYSSYTGLAAAPNDSSMDAAIAQSAHDTLVALYPSQKTELDQRLTEDIKRIPHGRAKLNGIDLGRRAAAAILALRANDGSERAEPAMGVDWIPSDKPGWWRQDPIGQGPLALGAYWGEVKPFVMKSADQFRLSPPPALTSAEYTAAFREVKGLGGDGVITPTKRTRSQTIAGIFWAYDGTPDLGTPLSLYNNIAVEIARKKGTDAVDLARLLELVNVAMADAGIAAWETKYEYQFWRPITAIREADEGTGPTGVGDGNPATVGDPNFTPLGAQASNLSGPNFTPPFPSYPSGHATFGGALFQILRRFYGTDKIGFTLVSDEFNGVTRDNEGNVRPRIPRSFSSLSEAEEENGQSRIYLGIHWSFDKTRGIAQGRRVADYVLKQLSGSSPPQGNATDNP